MPHANEVAENTYQDTVENETVDQMATAGVWRSLLGAALANKCDPFPYSYIYVTKVLPETLTMWTNGQVAMTALANTGIPVDQTSDATYPIYLRYTSQVMRGTTPNGTPYADLVYWVNYFNGGDAVHGIVRSSYRFPQSLGCVELPPADAAHTGRLASSAMIARGRRVTVGELLAEVPQPLDRPGVDRSVRFAQRRLDLLVDLGFEAAAAAVLEMLGDPPGRHLVECTVEVGLQHPHRCHAAQPARRGVPHLHRMLLFGARPAALRR